jgi:NADPH2:quinone reductase
VLVGVRAAGVSFVDGLMVGGAYQLKPRLPFTPGLVAAGEVLEVGDGVSSVVRGSRVVSSSFDLGGYATHRVLPADAVVPLPDAVSFEVAATAVESYATVLFALTTRAAVRPGEWVLVLGAGGGIGLAAVDVARSLGARVIAAASSQAKRAAAIDAGAQVAVDYQDLKARVREVTGAGGTAGHREAGPPAVAVSRCQRRGYLRRFEHGMVTLPPFHVEVVMSPVVLRSQRVSIRSALGSQ